MRRRQNKRNWKIRGVVFESDSQREEFLDRSMDGETSCFITGVTNRTHRERMGASLSLDHCHASGKPRGFLLKALNDVLGALERGHLLVEELEELCRAWREGRLDVKPPTSV